MHTLPWFLRSLARRSYVFFVCFELWLMNDGDVSFFVCGVRLADGRQSETSAVQSICTRSNDSVYECHLNEFFYECSRRPIYIYKV